MTNEKLLLELMAALISAHERLVLAIDTLTAAVDRLARAAQEEANR